MQKPHASLQIFKNPFLEKLTHVHPATPFVIWTPVALYLAWYSLHVHQLSYSLTFLLLFLGVFAWTFAEYALHRFAFHIEGARPFIQRLQFLVHGLHHVDPNDPTRLVMPPAGSLILAVILYGVFRVLFGPIWVKSFFSGFLLGYLCYDFIHYSVHHFRPHSRIGRYLKNNHMQHHYVNSNSRWGVSSNLWDYIFGTLEPSQSSHAQSPYPESLQKEGPTETQPV